MSSELVNLSNGFVEYWQEEASIPEGENLYKSHYAFFHALKYLPHNQRADFCRSIQKKITVNSERFGKEFQVIIDAILYPENNT